MSGIEIDPRPPWAQRITAARRAKRWSQSDAIAALRTVSPAMLAGDDSLRRSWKRWEGGQNLPRPDMQLLIGMAFGVDPSAIFDEAGDPLDIVTDLGTIELLQRVARGDVDQAAIDNVREMVDQLAADYSAMLPGDLLPEVNGWIARLDLLRQSRAGTTQHRQIMESSGWLALLAGSLLFDADKLNQAEAVAQIVEQIGREIGSNTIRAWATELDVWLALNRRDYPAAAELARTGQEIAPRAPVATQLAGHEAEARARSGDTRGALHALDVMRERRSRLPIPEHARHHFQLDPAKFDKVEMRIALLTGENDEARAIAGRVLANVGGRTRGKLIQPMLTAKTLSTLAVVAARSGDLDEAVALGHEALDIPRQTIPSLIITTSDLRTELRERRQDQAVAELLDRIGALRPAA